MCLAIPMRVIEKQGEIGKVEQGGVVREVSFALMPDVACGDHVLVHAGFAIERLEAAEAAETLALLRELMAAGEQEAGGD
ncbi:MAG: HypC/HybG/HupF family hydrogenase formation chaperone [Deltaproteobacteria bacterium]|nr:HypC/HybG/HupF family hydrogenase formation chaperone [Deltaproteobacteria bacterium]